VGVAVSVGLGLARNEISNVVDAYIRNADGASGNANDGVVTQSEGSIRIEAINAATITANAWAASAALGGGLVGVGFSGAGADARNSILTKTRAYVEDSDLVADDGDTTRTERVTISAQDTSTITAQVLGLSAAVGGGLVGGAVSIGSSTARNLIGWTLAGTESPAEVLAFAKNARIAAADALSISATESATISAKVDAASVALAGGAVAIAASGAGADVQNKVSTKVQA
jgi:hypothetical protein